MTITWQVALLATALALGLVTSATATETFDFYETGITCSGFGVRCVEPNQPRVIMSLTLSDPTETGSAIYAGLPAMTAQVTDANFQFDVIGHSSIAGPNFGAPAPFLSYAITWDEISGQLDGISENFYGGFSTVEIDGFGLAGGRIGSDGTYGGCTNGSCQITGYWQNAAIPEPGSATLLLSALLGMTFSMACARSTSASNSAHR